MKNCLIGFCLIGICLIGTLKGSALAGTTTDPSASLFSAKQLGLGGVTVNFADDAAGIFANPAGLAGSQFPQVTVSSRKLFLNETNYSLVTWAIPFQGGTIGLGYVGLGTGGSLPTKIDPGTGRIIIDPSSEVMSYTSSVMALSFSKPIRNFNFGGNLKLFNQAISGPAGGKGSGMGFDLGVQGNLTSWLLAGAVAQNLLGGTINWTSSEDKIGSFYKFGVAAKILGSSAEAFREHSQSLSAGLDYNLAKGSFAPNNFHFGLAYIPFKNLELRTGLNQENGGTNPTFGVGLTNFGFRFDYAYAARPGIPADNPNYFSLSYIGERVLTYDHKVKDKTFALKFLHPHNHALTDQARIMATAEISASKVIAKKSIWTVTGIAATYETEDILEPTLIANLWLNGWPLAVKTTIEAEVPLNEGKNTLSLLAYSSPEPNVSVGSAEIKILRVNPFHDTPITHWAAEPIYLNVTLGLVTGYPDNNFLPDKGITRAELVALLVRSLGTRPDELEALSSNEVFADVPKNDWAAKFIAFGNNRQLVSGYPDGDFKPKKVLNRAEGITIMARYAKLKEAPYALAPFPDLKDDFWANKNITPAKEAGLLKYLIGKEFKPNEKFTRAEACEVLYQVPAVKEKVTLFWAQ